jgi:hypothetical protein
MNPFKLAVIRELLDGFPLAPIDAGRPCDAVLPKLKALNIESLFEPREVVDRSMAACCISGLWLWHNYLDESHRISQEIETSAGSAWHGMMHRREGDFWNANYWFARVKDESLFPPMAINKGFVDFEPSECEYSEKLQRLCMGQPWSPKVFTDEVERILIKGRKEEIEGAVRVAAVEWRTLFRSCWRRAIGMSD